MEDFTEAKPLDIGPIYFFDQMKPERKKWEKRKFKDCFPNLEHISGAKPSSTENITSGNLEEEARLSTVASPEEKHEFHSCAISQIPVGSKFSTNLKFSEIHLQKSLFEELKHTAAEILCELGEILQIYAEYNIPFPVRIENFVNYTWHDLIEGASKCTTKQSTLKKHRSSQSDCSSMMTVDKIRSSSRKECHKENDLVTAKKDYHHVASGLLSQKQHSKISQGSSLPVVIHFSLSSNICLENGWILQPPYSKSEILKWKTVLDIAVKKLQGAIIKIKTEEARLKKEGFNQQLILSHYNDPKDKEEVSNSPIGSQCFWLELLKRKAQMPTVQQADPEMKKFHYALIDGSSVTYYPSGRVAVCQSCSALPRGGMYTNIFSDLPDQVILGTFTPFGCGSISFPNRQIISMMFNQDGGMVISKKGKIIREWIWPSKGKLDDPVETWVNKFMSVKISGRFAITLVYKWPPQSLMLSLAPVKCKSFPSCFPEASFPDVNPISKEASKLFEAYKMKCKLMKSTTQVKDLSSLTSPVDIATFDPAVDISPMSDIATVIKLRRLQKKAKHILLNWLDHYRFSLGMEPLHTYRVPQFPQKVVRKQKVALAELPQKQSAKEKDENKEYLLYRNSFLKLKGVFKPSPLPRIQKTPTRNQSFRPSLPTESKNPWFASYLVCPVVLRRILCGKEEDTCRCSTSSIPEVTDLEYDHLIKNQLSSVDQIVIVYVFSSREEDKTVKEVSKVYREQNRTRSMPCIQSRSDSFRFLKYNIISASKITRSNCPLLVQRHGVIPGIFLSQPKEFLSGSVLEHFLKVKWYPNAELNADWGIMLQDTAQTHEPWWLG